jgi:hypothetical protein
MTHYSGAFTAAIHSHYQKRLQDPSLPEHIRQFFLQKLQNLVEPLFNKIICKILNCIKMNNPHFPDLATQIHTDAIKHMAHVIEKRIQHNQPCFVHSNEQRIALKDADHVVLVWLKISKS